MTKKSRTRPDQLLAMERKRKAFALRKGGASYTEIADALGISVSTAHGYVTELLKQLSEGTKEDAEVVKQLELMRLDQMWMAIEGQIRKGHLQAIDKGLKVMDRRAKYLGLDSPIKAAITDPDGEPGALSIVGAGLASLLKAAENTAKAMGAEKA
ncbi:helix-turn-helix domain-containing protein [Pseudomonas sp. KCJK9000]|uniref:helix-turn-helix domain-containing protein n=1 Tax=Pseudomonas sp. KCJK9000 TaxID=3344566 RepID=UPI003905DC1D